MNSLIIVFIALVLFIWAYRFYARKLENLWQIDPKRSTPAFSKYDSVDYIPAKNSLILFGQDFGAIVKTTSPIAIFGKGYGLITNSILGPHGPLIAVTILNAFILTTLDTATRISRYLTEELFAIKNRYISTLFIVALSSILAFSGKWNKIWPAFGSSNQLVAVLALFVLSCWLLSKNKPVKYTLWPAFIMLITTVAALIFQVVRYFMQKDVILSVVSIILIILAGFMLCEILSIFIRRRYA